MALAPAKKDTAELSFESIGKLIDGFKTSPLGKTSGVLLSVIGFFASMKFEADVINRLEAIQAKLDEIDKKVSEILDLVRDLPRVIERKLSDQKKAELVSELNAHSRAIAGILAKHPKATVDEARRLLDPADAVEMRRRAEDMLTAAYELQDWGPDAFVSLGQAYAAYLTALRVSGKVSQDIGFVRQQMLSQAEIAHSMVSQAHILTVGKCAYERELLTAAGGGRVIYVGSAPIGGGGGQFSDFWAVINGTPDTGFWGDMSGTISNYPNQNFRPVLGSGFPAQPFDARWDQPGHQVKDNYAGHLSDRARQLRETEALVPTLKDYDSSSKTLLLMLTVPVVP